MTKMLRTLLVLVLGCAILLSLASCKTDGNNDVNDGGNNVVNGGGDEHVHSFVIENAVPNALKSEASCTSKEIYYKSCSCGEIGSETFEYGEYAHNFDVQSTEDKYLELPATCTEASKYYYSCSCGAVGEGVFEYGEPTDHTFENRVCTACGVETSSEGLIFDYNEYHNHYSVSGFTDDIPEDVYISKYNGLDIVAIDFRAFENCTKIKNLYLSGPVSSIGQEAFQGCTNLENVHLGNVVAIQTGAFADCPNLEQFTIAEDNTGLELIDNCIITETTLRYEDRPDETFNMVIAGCKNSVIPADKNIGIIGEKAFCGAIGLESIVIPESVKYINPRAFYGCTGLKEITLNNGIELLSGAVFKNCTGLEKLYYNIPNANLATDFENIGINSDGVAMIIGKDVKSIPALMFSECSGITSIVFEECCAIESIGIRAFNGTSITTIEIPETVTYLGEFAFEECDKLTSVSLPDGITEIDNGMFWGCDKLVNVKLPANLTKFGESVFYNCDSLTTVAIPDTVTYIDNGTFSDCDSLTSIIIPKEVTYIGLAFYRSNNLTIYCRAEEQPSTWEEMWNDDNRPVVWGYKG